jgi:UDP-glucose 4-epimerase
VLIASTSEVYGDHREEKFLHESARRVYRPTTARRWAYADSKAIDEFHALGYRDERGPDCIVARLFNTVGPRQNWTVRDGHSPLRRQRAGGANTRGLR